MPLCHHQNNNMLEQVEMKNHLLFELGSNSNEQEFLDQLVKHSEENILSGLSTGNNLLPNHETH
jgi:hypothetical protein